VTNAAESGSFLKKRTKKLLPCDAGVGPPAEAPGSSQGLPPAAQRPRRRAKVFARFFQKALLFLQRLNGSFA
jgi:hypothetical protein